MPTDNKKRSRSPSESRSRTKKNHHKRKDNKRFENLQDQITNLTKVMEAFPFQVYTYNIELSYSTIPHECREL